MNLAVKCKAFFYGNREIKKDILTFSAPLVAELMLLSLISIINLSMVGHLGAYALGSVGLTSQPVFISNAVFQAFNVGATALIARFIGAKDYANAKVVVWNTLIIAFFSSLLLSIVAFIYSPQIVAFMGAKEDTLVPATMYMRYMAVGMFFQGIPTAVASILRGSGRSKPPMIYNIVANIVNVIVGFVLINGILFFPRLGLEGAAIGATAAKIVSCVMSIVVLTISPYPVNISIRDKISFHIPIVKRIMDISMSAAGEQFIMRVGFLIYTKIIADLGTTALASHQITNSISGLVSNVVGGLGIAASSFTGRSLGAAKPELAKKYTDEIRNMGAIFSFTVGILFWVAGIPLASIFSHDPDVVHLTAKVLIISGFMTFPQNIQQVLAGSLRGAGDTKWPLVSALISVTFCRILLAFIVVKYFHMGLFGAWMCALTDQSIRAVLIRARYKKGAWKNITV